jgi:hypothetical protein
MLQSSRAAERRSSAPPADSVLRSNRDAQRASEARAAGNPTPGPRLQHAARRRRHPPGKERRHALDQPRRVHDRRGVRLVVVHKLRERRERRAPRGAAGAEHESREARQDPGARRTPTGFGLQPTRVPRAPAHHVPDALGRSLLRAARRSREERGEVAHTQRPEVAERFDDAGGMQPGGRACRAEAGWAVQGRERRADLRAREPRVQRPESRSKLPRRDSRRVPVARRLELREDLSGAAPRDVSGEPVVEKWL